MPRISQLTVTADRCFFKSGAGFRRPSPALCVLAIAALLLVTAPAFGDAPPPSIPFHFVRGFAVVIPVSVNGHGPYDFMLDTGTMITTVDRTLASELALVARAQGTAVTLSENVPAAIAIADRVSFGPIEERKEAVMVRDLSGLRNLVPTARGVLGQNALLHADFLLDYRHKRVEFDVNGDLLRSLGGHHVPLRRAGMSNSPQFSNMVVHADISSDGAYPMDLLLDSGAASMVLFGSLGGAGIAEREGFVVDTGGRQAMAGIRELQLTIDGKTRELSSHVLPFRAAGPGVDGLLPTSLFDRVYISNCGAFAIFEPKVKKGHREDHMIAGIGAQSSPHGPKS